MGIFGKRKILFMSLLLLLILCTSAVIALNIRSIIETYTLTGKRVPFTLVVTGNGTGKIAGYFGFISQPSMGEKFFSHTFVSVLPSANINNIMLLANASGYETILVVKPLEYDWLPPRVAIRHHVILYPNNITICFTIIVLENGYVSVSVGSDYFLREDWMRIVFSKMLLDIHLLPITICRFELAINGIGTIDPPPPFDY